MPPTRPIARTPTEAYATVNPDEALQSGDDRYVPLDNVRGINNLAESLCTRILAHEENNVSGIYARFLVTGHRGCGKTTELLMLTDFVVDGDTALKTKDFSTTTNFVVGECTY